MTEIQKSILMDIIKLTQEELSLNILFQDLKDDPDAYDYDIDDLETFLLEFGPSTLE